MTATYFILMDLKSRNKSIRLLPNRIQQMTFQTFNRYDQQSNSIPASLLREKNQESTPRSRTIHQHPPPADLLLISQQDKTYLPSNSDENRSRNHKTPNKENSQTQHHERTTPTVK